MLDTKALLLESWDRQAGMIRSLAARIDESSQSLRTDPEGMTLAEALCHIHTCRWEWMNEVSESHASQLQMLYTRTETGWQHSEDLSLIRAQLDASAAALREAVEAKLGEGQAGTYKDALFYLQHMIWHEGWHYGLMTLALRLAGKEPTEEWEEATVWGVWRS